MDVGFYKLWESSMDAHSFARTPYLVRAPLLLREILLAFVSETDSCQHPLVDVFGFDQITYDFVKQSTAATLLKLSASFVKANAITFNVNERMLKSLLRSYQSDSSEILSVKDISALDPIYSHRQVVRELVMFMADSLSDIGAGMSNIIEFDHETRRLLNRADVKQLEWLSNQMVERRCVQFTMSQDKIRDRTYSYMRHERREGIKDILVSKKAPYGLMYFLFSEETEESVKWRRYRLGVTPLKGRPKTAPAKEFIDFVCLWTSNQNQTELERFLMAHRQLGYGFDILWALYQRAEIDGEFNESILKATRKNKNLACQI